MLNIMYFLDLSVIILIGCIFIFENLMKVTPKKNAHLHKIVLNFRQT